jgi:hypothetical protein
MPPKMTPSKPTKRILAALGDVNRQLSGKCLGNAVWTVSVKQRLCLLGEELGHCTSASGARGHFGEWVYDVSWLDYKLKSDGMPGASVWDEEPG